jgi:DNA-binding response OmpR family regulator
LIVEDDETIGSVLASTLTDHGHEVIWHRLGGEALAEAAATPLEFILLDLGLPDLDGIEVCRQLRILHPEAVLVMLTARTEEMDVVVGLEAGADDYLTKPVRFGELLARLRAHLRRVAPPPGLRGRQATAGDLTVDTAGRRVMVSGRELSLRTKEFDLLARLIANPGIAVSRETLMSQVWDEHWFGPTKTLDVHVAVLRRKLAEMAEFGSVPRIVTLRGHGYRLDPPAR